MTALTDAARPSATLHMNIAYTRSLRRWVAAAALILAAPIAAGAQTEFHYQYGKLTNPFSGERAYTSIVTVQQASSWALGDSFVFVDILEDGGINIDGDANVLKYLPGARLSWVLAPFAVDQAADLCSCGHENDDSAAGRWCADAGRPTRFKPSSPSPTDAVRDGSAKLGHPVQNVTREHGLTPLPR